jgi:uncharacterized protein
MTDAKPLRCEVTYATPQRQWVVPLDLAPGATVEDAVQASGLLENCPELARGSLVLGIFGTIVEPRQAVREGDRVEIYRPLKADPRTARRARVARARR